MKKAAMTAEQLKYLTLLSARYPSIRDASVEIINLQAILNLPKGTEHFLSDIHGEYESFNHVLRNASGVIKSYIHELFANSMRDSELKSLATLVYYPLEKLSSIKKTETNMADWYKVTFFRLITLCKRVSSKYTRSKVRKALDPDYAYIMEELIHENASIVNKHDYYNQIIETIINIGRADDYIIEICNLIQRLAIDQLHIIGDIFDRGPDADKILDALSTHSSFDIQWGNHDISWMGAAAGSAACILNVIRISARYANLHTLEDGYGINLVPLATYALEHYSGTNCKQFVPEQTDSNPLSDKESRLISEIHKAVCILQFKAEAAVIRRHPGYEMDDRLLLDKIDYKNGTIELYGKTHKLIDWDFPTVDPNDPYALTEEEEDILDKLIVSFQNSPKLQSHARMLFSKGRMYKIFNNNLLFHGCIPMNPDGTLKEVYLDGKYYKGRAFLDAIEIKVRGGYLNQANPESMLSGQDLMWYLWCGADSPLFGKDRMTTFERYFIADKDTHFEKRDPYYDLRNSEEVCDLVLENFGLNPAQSHIINGHVPVKVSKGESPIKANGKLLVIDGGFAKAYQKVTGIAGYTLIYNSHGLVLASHEPFESTQKAIEEEIDIHSSSTVLEFAKERIRVGDTDTGIQLKETIADLMDLLRAYETGILKESDR